MFGALNFMPLSYQFCFDAIALIPFDVLLVCLCVFFFSFTKASLLALKFYFSFCAFRFKFYHVLFDFDNKKAKNQVRSVKH